MARRGGRGPEPGAAAAGRGRRWRTRRRPAARPRPGPPRCCAGRRGRLGCSATVVVRRLGRTTLSPGPPSSSTTRCDRWRDLYRAALAEQAEQNRIVLDQSAGKRAQDAARGPPREAENQLRLLRNEDIRPQPVRLLLLPLPRQRGLPARLLLPPAAAGRLHPRDPRATASADGDYLQRPRFLAISEFGPGALIYHEGARYEVNRIQLPADRPAARHRCDTEDARRCESCGYHHPVAVGTDVCEHWRAAAGGDHLRAAAPADRVHPPPRTHLQRRGGAPPRRLRAGDVLPVRQPRRPSPDASDASAAGRDGTALLDLVYGDAATVRVANVGRRRRKEPDDRGFWLDTVKRPLADRQAGRRRHRRQRRPGRRRRRADQAKVIPYVEDTRNILLVRLAEPVDESTAASLRYALERGIEAAFQLEDSELTSSSCPTTTGAAGCCSPSPPRAAPGCCAASSTSRPRWPPPPGRRWRSATSTPTPARTCGRRTGGERVRAGLLRLPAVLPNQLEHPLHRPARRDRAAAPPGRRRGRRRGRRPDRGEQRRPARAAGASPAWNAPSSSGWTSTGCGSPTGRRSPSPRPPPGPTSCTSCPAPGRGVRRRPAPRRPRPGRPRHAAAAPARRPGLAGHPGAPRRRLGRARRPVPHGVRPPPGRAS